MSLSHRDRGSKNRSGSRKNRKLGERVIQRGEPVSGYGERRPRDPRDRSEEPGSQAASGPRCREDGLWTRRRVRDVAGLGSSSRGPALGRR